MILLHPSKFSGASTRQVKRFAPLLLSLAVSQAFALDYTLTGPNGANGASGANGSAAPDLTYLLTSGSAFNRLSLTGGNGGNGGNNPADGPGSAGGGGNGGNGASALGRAVSVSVSNGALAEANVVGGNGGNSGADFYGDNYQNNGGSGGNAASFANASAVSGPVSARAYATGGNGALFSGTIGAPILGSTGNGGSATAQASASSLTGDVLVLAQATGGNGGGRSGDYVPRGGGAAVTLENRVTGTTRGALSLFQHAIGGNGGPDGTKLPGFGGDARSTLTLSDGAASALSGNVSAKGGAVDMVDYFDDSLTTAGKGVAELTLKSTRAGSAVDGTVTAVGGDNLGYVVPSRVGGEGGSARASATLTGTAAVSGRATATGGASERSGANAVADLSIRAGGLASGDARATGGLQSGTQRYWDYSDGTATASLALVGLGARGVSDAKGSNATSTINATTSGALAVDVESRALAGLGTQDQPRGSGGSATATTIVNAAGTGGQAAVKAGAYATGSGTYANANAVLRVASSGPIVGTAWARSGAIVQTQSASGAADAFAQGVTSGVQAVTLNALASSDYSYVNDPTQQGAHNFGNATAKAVGVGGSGVVNVTAQALSGVSNNSKPTSSASAKADTALFGGVSNARAIATGAAVNATANATAIGANGAQLGFTAAVSGATALRGTATASNRFDAASFALAAGHGGSAGQAELVSYAAAGPVGGAAALGASATTAAALTDIYGVGMQEASRAGEVPGQEGGDPSSVTSGQFQFVSAVDQHLLIAFLAAGGTGFDSLDLSISNHGALLFSQSFTSLADANLFFADRVLDLGLFGAGPQDIVVRSSLMGSDYGYAFNYAIGGGSAVAPVPEASSWMMMMIGLTGIVIVVRRRKSATAAA